MRIDRPLMQKLPLCSLLLSLVSAAHAQSPAFRVDASWPKPLAEQLEFLGQVGGITVDGQGHIWLIHRPRSLTDDEKGAAIDAAALEMLHRRAASAGIRQRRQPAARLGRPRRKGYQWVGRREHGIEVDDRGFVSIGGNADNDNARS